jgi:hypothetical protein
MRQVWTHLANRFASKSQSRISHLKRQLHNLQQGSQTYTEYLRTAKSLTDQLTVIGHQIPDEDLISFILSGLNSSYNIFVQFYSLTTRDNCLTFEDFQAELLTHEILIENQNSTMQSDVGNSAFFTHKRGTNSSYEKKKYGGPPKFHQYRPGSHRGHFQNQFHGPRQHHFLSNTQQPAQHHFPRQPHRFPQQQTPFPQQQLSHKQHQFWSPPSFSSPSQFFNGNSSKSPCQICGKSNHRAADCYHRMDYAYQSGHPPSQLVAMVAQSNFSHEDEQPWFADSGANAHITSSLENLSIQQPFQGNESVAIGNIWYWITNPKHSFLHIPYSSFTYCLENYFTLSKNFR